MFGYDYIYLWNYLFLYSLTPNSPERLLGIDTTLLGIWFTYLFKKQANLVPKLVSKDKATSWLEYILTVFSEKLALRNKIKGAIGSGPPCSDRRRAQRKGYLAEGSSEPAVSFPRFYSLFFLDSFQTSLSLCCPCVSPDARHFFSFEFSLSILYLAFKNYNSSQHLYLEKQFTDSNKWHRMGSSDGL